MSRKTNAQSSRHEKKTDAAPRRRRVRDRGTVLLMVIGVLALMAIIAVVYATLGRSERQSVSALNRAEKNDAVSRAVADYTAQVIGDGLFAEYPEYTPANDAFGPFNLPNAFSGNLEMELRIKAFDYPGVDDRAITVYRNGQPGTDAATDGAHMFMATGSFMLPPLGARGAGIPRWTPPATGSATNLKQPRDWRTPFLAATEPTYIEPPPWITGQLQTLSPNAVGSRTLTVPPQQLFRDWTAISNLAPSGNFVNLVNLRNNFDAESGFGIDAKGKPRMSAQLMQYQRSGNAGPGDGGVAEAAPANQDPDTNIPGMVRWDGQPVRLNRPADWTNNQLYLHRPMVDVQYPPSDPRYLFNSFADVDADLFADSRWYELTKLSHDSSAANVYFAESLLAAVGAGRGAGEMRYFVATRVIDNSSMVNVNTATDFHREPTFASPPGVTPADVDLRRLLTLYDTAQFFSRYPALNATVNDLPYAFFQRRSPVAGSLGLGSYDRYSTSVSTLTENAGYEIGIAGYAGLRDSIARGGIQAGALDGQRYYSGANQNATLRFDPLTASERAEYFDRVADAGGTRVEKDVNGTNSYNEQYTRRTEQALFTLADEYELRVFNGLNDDQNTSRLESAVGGRRPPLRDVPSAELSPLRDNRSLALDRYGRDLPIGTAEYDDAKLLYLIDPRKNLTTISGARPIVDVSKAEFDRRGLKLKLDVTPLLGKIREGAYLGDAPGYSNLTTQQVENMVQAQADRYDAIRQIFTAYVDALAPYADKRASWEAPPAGQERFWNLAYGGSTEFAMRAAMHLALNLADTFDKDRSIARAGDRGVGADSNAASGNNRLLQKQRTDDDHVPTAMVLGVTKSAIAEFGNAALPAGDGLYRVTTSQPTEVQDLFPWPGLFCVSSTTGQRGVRTPDLSKHAQTFAPANRSVVLTDSLGATPSSVSGSTASVPQPAVGGSAAVGNGVERVIGFGIEPQPFLTDVRMYAIRTDAATGAGGDKDGDDIQDAAGNPPGVTSTKYVTLVPKRDLANADFVCDILAFTLQNPFDERVYLYRATGSDTRSVKGKPRFYLEFANRFYIFAKQSASGSGTGALGVNTDDDVLLEPGETRVFYVTNPGRLSDLAARIQNLRLGATFTKSDTVTWLRGQLGNNIADEPIVQVDPRSFEPIAYTEESFTLGVASVTLPADPARAGNETVAGTGPSLQQVKVDLLGEEDLQSLVPSRSPKERDLPVAAAGPGVLGFGESIPQGRGVAMLWRVMREPANPSIAQGNETVQNADYKRQNESNDFINDLLADRLRDPDIGNDSNIWKLAGDLDGTDALGTGLPGRGWLNATPTWTGGPDRTTCTGGGPVTGDNFGVVVVARAGFGRPFDPDLGSNIPTRGYLPAWCLESKLDRDNSSTWHSAGSAARPWSLNWSAHDVREMTGGVDVARDVCQYFSATDRFNDRIKEPMSNRRTTSTPAAQTLSFSGRSNEPQRPYRQVAPVYVSPVLVGRGDQQRSVLNPGLFSRAGDFMLPLAVGPEYVPGRSPSQNAVFTPGVDDRLRELETQWLTLSEALAMGCGYYSPPNPAGGSFPVGSSALQYNVGNDTRDSTAAAGTVPIVPKIERGGLVIDAWEPFVTIGNSANRYTPLRSGVPLALGIMDQFRVAPGVSSIDGRDQLREQAYGSETAVVPGTINVNTAPTSVLRVLPMVSPEVFADQGAGARSVTAAWTSPGPNADPVGRCCVSVTYGAETAQICQVLRQSVCNATPRVANFTANQVCDPGDLCGSFPQDATAERPAYPVPTQAYNTPAPLPRPANRVQVESYDNRSGLWTNAAFLFDPTLGSFAWDIAPTIAAYRDKNVVPLRPVNRVPTPEAHSTFLDQDQYQGNGRFSAFGTPGDALLNGVYGAREQVGFKSVGELLMANQYGDHQAAFGTGVTTSAQRRLPVGPDSAGSNLLVNGQSVQRFGARADSPIIPTFMSGALGTLREQTTGIAPALPTPIPAVTGNTLASRIAVANALSNIATVRSDIFTAYFVVHGYTRADVEGLADDQPMVPSLAKRFVMVIDRSNVVRPGDKPKVLLFKEVPLE